MGVCLGLMTAPFARAVFWLANPGSCSGTWSLNIFHNPPLLIRFIALTFIFLIDIDALEGYFRVFVSKPLAKHSASHKQ